MTRADIETDTFTYTLTDLHGASNSATVTVTLTGVNDAPVANDDAEATDEDTVLVSVDSLFDNDTDVDANDMLTVFNFDATSALGAAIVVNPDGTYTYDPTNAAGIQALDAGLIVDDTFGYTVSDSQGETSGATVTITLLGANDVVIASDDSGITNEDSAITIDVLLNDSDIDLADLIVIDSFTQGSNGTVALVNDQLEYTPNLNFNGSDSFTYVAIDLAGSTSLATVTVTIDSINDAPIAMPDTYLVR